MLKNAIQNDILVASAVISGAIAALMIDAEVDGKGYQETHVDGGASAGVPVPDPPSTFALRERTTGSTRERRTSRAHKLLLADGVGSGICPPANRMLTAWMIFYTPGLSERKRISHPDRFC